MSTGSFVILLGVLFGALVVLLVLRNAERRREDENIPRVPAPRASVSDLEVVVQPSVTDIALGVFFGLWLFAISAGGLAALFTTLVWNTATKTR